MTTVRPFESHFNQGEEAWIDGKTEADNPYREGTLAHVNWLTGHLSAMAESGDLSDTAEDCTRVYLLDTTAETRRTATRLSLDLPSASVVAEAIGLPTEEWVDNCYSVSVAVLESGILDAHQEQHGALFPAYGMYEGPIAPGQRGMSRHGWLESVEGHVVDPTRWVFTDDSPSLWAGPIDEYDLGGMRLRSRFRATRVPEPEGEPMVLGINDPNDLAAFDRVLRDRTTSRTGAITPNRFHWVVTSPLEQLGQDASLFFRTAERLGRAGLVPVDNRLWVEFATKGYDPALLRSKLGGDIVLDSKCEIEVGRTPKF